MSCMPPFQPLIQELRLTCAVLPAEQAQYSAIIDGILASSDLSTISAKQIRKTLQEKLEHDISDKKVNFYFAPTGHS